MLFPADFSHIDWQTFFSVLAWATFKFSIATGIAATAKLSVLETFIALSLGSMASTAAFAFGGREIRNFVGRWWKPNPTFARKRKLVKFWRKYGLLGMTLLQPMFFAAYLSVPLAVSFREHTAKILRYYFSSCIGWALVVSLGQWLWLHLSQ